MVRHRPSRCPEDFADAAKRHWHDAEELYATRTAAADHHVGIAAECAVKHAICTSYATSLSGAPRMHIDKLWGQAAALIDPVRFNQLQATLSGANPFDSWSIDDRYANTAFICNDIDADDGGGPRRDVRRRAVQVILRQAGLMP
ncbi:hypothetical protein [Azospirillum sp. ST 5-10]|uniref:hypothetical protein n=1 Tax=unclassified Azospirillum TaxID=2630922 RepID=UPI003F49DC0D